MEILEEIRRVDSFAAAEIAAQIEAFQPHLVVNQVRDTEDERIGDSIETISDRFLGVPLRFAGSVPYDPVLVRSVKSRRPYLVEYPRSRTSEAFRAAAEMIHDPWPVRPAPAEALYPRPSASDRDRALNPYHARDLYRALDLAPGATHEEILAAYVRLRPALRADSPALVSLDCEPERRAALLEIEAAFRALSRNLSTQASSGHRRAGA
jgi:hypothetical protein